MKYQFSSIYLVERSHHANFFLQLGGSIQWVFNLRRDLVDAEINDLAILIDMLMKVFFLSILRIRDYGLLTLRVTFLLGLSIMC